LENKLKKKNISKKNVNHLFQQII